MSGNTLDSSASYFIPGLHPGIIRRQISTRQFRQMMLGITGMGVMLSFLLNVNYGTDPCSFMNNALALHFGIPLGTVMVLTNLLLFIPEIIWGRRLIGIGTIANMTLIGYICDFCRYLWKWLLPDVMFQAAPWRPLVFAAALTGFLVSAALYMNAGLGQVPYDSIATMICFGFNLPYFLVRMIWDFLIIGIGMLAGGRLTIATVLMALLLGPTVSRIGRLLTK